VTARRSPAPARASAAFVAAFVLLCQAAAWVHGAATPHVTCSEHGESVDVQLNAGVAPPTSDLAEVADVVAPAIVAPAAHGHDHCGLQVHRTTTAPAPSPSFSLAALDAPSAPLVAFAPKTSPPAAPTV
jgi:hypothetical protein